MQSFTSKETSQLDPIKNLKQIKRIIAENKALMRQETKNVTCQQLHWWACFGQIP
jgi:hypothetical protein